MKLKPSDWILEQERNTRNRAIVYFVVAITLITGVIGLHSLSLGAPSMVPAGVNVDNLRGAAHSYAEGAVK
jgi:hypothetical protein